MEWQGVDDPEPCCQELLSNRKAKLAKLLAAARAGLQYSEHLEGDGAAIFAYACKLGCEGIVSKHREHPYRSGPSKAWLKIKDPAATGVLRAYDSEAFLYAFDLLELDGEDWRSRPLEERLCNFSNTATPASSQQTASPSITADAFANRRDSLADERISVGPVVAPARE